MVFDFDAEAGARLHRYFVWIHVSREPGQPALWFSDATRRWQTELHGKGGSSCAPCRTFRAFKSHLRRHASELRGRKVTLVSRYHGHDISVQL
jgi:hypothetical protein